MATQIRKSSTIMVAKDRIWCDMAGEAVILNLDSGVYFGLNPVGARIWNLIQQPITVECLLDQIVKEYEVRLDRCEEDIVALLQDLAAHELIVIEADHNGANSE